jgi:hypothetical protein
MMTGKDRILTILNIDEPDRIPLYLHAVNKAPIIGIGKHLTDGLPEPKKFHHMHDCGK